MPHFFAIELGPRGVGEVEYHADDREQVDHVLGGLDLEIGAALRAGWGTSTTERAPITYNGDAPPADLVERAKDAFRDLKYEVGVM